MLFLMPLLLLVRATFTAPALESNQLDSGIYWINTSPLPLHHGCCYCCRYPVLLFLVLFLWKKPATKNKKKKLLAMLPSVDILFLSFLPPLILFAFFPFLVVVEWQLSGAGLGIDHMPSDKHKLANQRFTEIIIILIRSSCSRRCCGKKQLAATSPSTHILVREIVVLRQRLKQSGATDNDDDRAEDIAVLLSGDGPCRVFGMDVVAIN